MRDAPNTRVLDGPRRHYDPEPSPDGRFLAIGVDVEGVGESDLEIWQLSESGDGDPRGVDGGPERIASRAQALDEPRWSPDGRKLVVSHPIPDPGGDDEMGGGFGGVAFAWSRLFLLRRDLGTPSLLGDGEAPGHFRAGRHTAALVGRRRDLCASARWVDAMRCRGRGLCESVRPGPRASCARRKTDLEIDSRKRKAKAKRCSSSAVPGRRGCFPRRFTGSISRAGRAGSSLLLQATASF